MIKVPDGKCKYLPVYMVWREKKGRKIGTKYTYTAIEALPSAEGMGGRIPCMCFIYILIADN